MTLRELQNDVAALGFASLTDYGISLLSSANRALRLIFSESRITATARILAMNPPVIRYIKSAVHIGGCTETLPLEGRAYSLIANGLGTVTVRDKTGVRTYELTGGKKRLYGFTEGAAEIRFEGEYGFAVSSFYMYGEIFGDSEADIPDGTDRHFYDVRRSISDFAAFSGPARTEDGRILNNVMLSDGKLIIKGESNQAIFIEYKRTPRKITGANDDEIIDIPSELEGLLPLLTAAFMWLDDDEEKAQYYMQLYREFKSRIPDPGRPGGSDDYIDTNRWA